MDLVLFELLYYLWHVLGYSETTNEYFFIREIIIKVLPVFFIAFCVGTLDSLKSPFNNLGKSLLSGIVILTIAILGSIAMVKVSTQAGAKQKHHQK